jgi:hypothetical protein
MLGDELGRQVKMKIRGAHAAVSRFEFEVSSTVLGVLRVITKPEGFGCLQPVVYYFEDGAGVVLSGSGSDEGL